MTGPAVTTTEVVNADIINAAADDKSVVVEPAADGSTIFTFDNSNLRYWAIQFEGTVGDSTPALGNGQFDASTDLKIGCIRMEAVFYDVPHSPDMTLARSVEYDQNKILKSIGD